MKVAIYARVSKTGQNPENQILSLEQYAKDKGFEVYETYIDRISGSRDTRPALHNMIKDAREKKFEAVIIWKLDRLGRSLQHLIRIVETLKRYNIDLICKTQNIDTTSSTGKFTFYLFGAIAELERELITERINLGLERAKSKGVKLGRPRGSKDRKNRRKSGYYQRWSKKTPSEKEDMYSLV